MKSVQDFSLHGNIYQKLNFNGGDLSSDAGLLLIRDFVSKIGFDSVVKSHFKTNDPALFRFHTDFQNFMQIFYQVMAGYFTDDTADELTFDPVFNNILDKDSLASQPTLSRFYNRMDQMTLHQLESISQIMRKKVYSIKLPEHVIFDLDSTLLAAFGAQIGVKFNYHYQAYGYHPLVCYDGMTGDLIKIQLRDGSDYSCTGVDDFIKPVLDEYQTLYPEIDLFLRGDSGFATPELYELCETNSTSYVIRLKQNRNLIKLAAPITEELHEIVQKDTVSYAVAYGEFMYQAKSWQYPRRVVCKVEKPANQMVYMYTFIVTNTDMSAKDAIAFYCKRGKMENFIKESKNGFDFSAVSSHSKLVNANRLQLHALVYNIFNWFRRLVLPGKMAIQSIDTIRLKLIKIAARITHSSRYTIFQLCSSCAYKAEFIKTLMNIEQLPVLQE